jgi:amino acid adenylation domain-containing protein
MTNAKLLTKENIKDVYTLSPVQEGILFHSLLEEDSTYFQQAAFRFRGELNVNRVQETLQELVDRHEVLRTAFKYKGLDVPLQIVLKQWSADFVYHDLRHNSKQQEFIRDFRKADREHLFDLSKDALMRLAVLQLTNDEYELLWSHHHIIMDGWCLNILLNEFFEIYNSKQEHRPSRLPEAEPYSRYIKWLESRDKEEAREYWQTYLKGYNEAARLAPRKPGREYLREKVLHTVGAEKLSALQSLAASNRATVPHLLRAIWGLIVARYTGTRDVVFGEVITGRPPELDKVETMIGLFVDTIPVRVKLDEKDRFTDLLALVRHDSLAREEYSHFPLNEIQSLSEIEGSLFDHLISFHNHSGVPIRSNNGAGNFSIVDSFEQTNYDLVFDVHLSDTLNLSFTYNAHVHERSFIERLAKVFETVMDQVLAQPSISVSNIGLMPQGDRVLMDQFNATDREFSVARSVAQIIEDIAAATPESTAIVFRDQTVSYGELNDEANRLAHFLSSQVSLAPDQRVALVMERSDLMVACILAVWKLGAAYVPIDINYPADRIRTLITDAEARLVLTDNAIASLSPETTGLIHLDQHTTEIAAQSATNLALPFAPESLAYVIYTSGSTGKPKGVMIEHIGMLNHLFAKIAEFELDGESVVAQNASHCFDISIWQWFAALLVGGRTVIYDNETVLNPEAQLQRFAADGVTVFETVPSYLEVMLSVVEEKQLAAQFATLRYMIVNGEVFKPALVRKWFELVRAVKLVNAYGATEVSDDSNHYIMSEAPPYDIIPLGATLPNLRIYIADEHMNLCPIGVKGEILIAGIGVGRGYLNDEERTRRAFTEDPFRQERGVRLYHTGDLGRYLDDGRLEFAGRKDYQVKVRGYRIELEEIEAVVMQHARVREAMVIDKQDAAGDSYLSCYLAADDGFEVEELRSFVGQKLPHYMVPSYFTVLPSLPLNENGKHDRKALMQLRDAVENGDHHTTYVAPRDEVEEKLARVWQEVLRLERVGVKDDFFALGGDSFKAIRVVSKFGRGFLVPDLFNNPTVERLAEIVRRNGDENQSLLYELSPKGGEKKFAVVAVPHSAGDPLVYQRTCDALMQLSDQYQFFGVAQPRPEPAPGETFETTLQQLTTQIIEEARKIPIPIILYGQSNGTGLTLELARAMEREQFDLRAVCMGGALPRLSVDPSTLGIDTRSDDDILGFVKGLGSIVPEDPADLAIFIRNFKYDSIIAVITYYNALRDMQNGKYVKLEAPLFLVTGDRDPLTRNYQTKYRDWFKFARRVGLVVVNNVGHYLLRDTPEDVARLLHRIGTGNFEGVTDDEGTPTGVLTKLRAVFARG